MLFLHNQVKVDLNPRLLKPDLYEAAKGNDTERVIQLLVGQVQPTFIDKSSGWTVFHFTSMIQFQIKSRR